MMASVSEAVVTLIPPADRPDALYEFVGGKWKETPRMGALASILASILDRRIGIFAEQNALGLSMTETLFRLAPEGPARRPDVAFVSFDRWPYREPLPGDPVAIEVVPDLAVEMVGPATTFSDVVDKVRDYFFAGAQLVWVVLPLQKQVYVYTAPDQIRILGETQELDGGAVMQGFRLSLASLFASPVKPGDV
jgi:Uma2 family endonuclease